mmetsp:Transcript_29689/g.48332  ORF Transcript_29689/g.48332 Transcript_29689/m.48332 type:complete len:287 (-) Transcript_29689:353-1213(-)
MSSLARITTEMLTARVVTSSTRTSVPVPVSFTLTFKFAFLLSRNRSLRFVNAVFLARSAILAIRSIVMITTSSITNLRALCRRLLLRVTRFRNPVLAIFLLLLVHFRQRQSFSSSHLTHTIHLTLFELLRLDQRRAIDFLLGQLSRFGFGSHMSGQRRNDCFILALIGIAALGGLGLVLVLIRSFVEFGESISVNHTVTCAPNNGLLRLFLDLLASLLVLLRRRHKRQIIRVLLDSVDASVLGGNTIGYLLIRRKLNHHFILWLDLVLFLLLLFLVFFLFVVLHKL